MTVKEMLELGKPYGVTGISIGGCIKGSPIHLGEPGAMRKRGHAHAGKHCDNQGCICFKAHTPERIGKRLFWHEVAHIYRPSWTETQCNKWANRQ